MEDIIFDTGFLEEKPYRELIEQGRFGEVLQSLRGEVAKPDVRIAERIQYRAEAHIGLGNLEDAIRDVDSLIDHGFCAMPRVYGKLGHLCLRNQQYLRAVESFTNAQARSVDPDPSWYEGNGDAMFHLRRFGAARGWYERAVEHINTPDLWYKLGRATFNSGKLELGATHLRRAVFMDNELLYTRVELGIALSVMGNLREAHKLFSSVIRAYKKRSDFADARDPLAAQKAVRELDLMKYYSAQTPFDLRVANM